MRRSACRAAIVAGATFRLLGPPGMLDSSPTGGPPEWRSCVRLGNSGRPPIRQILAVASAQPQPCVQAVSGPASGKGQRDWFSAFSTGAIPFQLGLHWASCWANWNVAAPFCSRALSCGWPLGPPD